MAAVKSQGTTLKFTPASGTQQSVGKLTSVGEISPDSEALDVTTLDSQDGFREYMQGFRDGGEVEVEGFFSAGDAGQSALAGTVETAGAAAALCAALPLLGRFLELMGGLL